MSNVAGGQEAMWGGRFETGPAELFRAANDSLPFDWVLVHDDIKGSKAWARAIAAIGVINGDERDRLLAGLDEVAQHAASLDSPPTESGAEDVHTWVEWQLVERVGDLGKKLHSGRSRNDQVATDLRLWFKRAVVIRIEELVALRRALAERAIEHAETLFPAYTHLQPAQPITFGHWCLAYAAMLERDTKRLFDLRTRADECPLGSGALTGSGFPVDREAIASELGFREPTHNSLDAVSDRDFVLEFLSSAALTAAHLSRYAEDLIAYVSPSFGLVTLSDAVTSGSSLMPQKKNPDSLEIIRGKAGRIAAHHSGLLMTVKGLPLAYNKDLQEDKEPLFDAMAQLSIVLRLADLTMRELSVNTDAAAAACRVGYQNATELADHLVVRGVPFREAHHQAGRAVRLAVDRGVALEAMSLDEIRDIAPDAGESLLDMLEPEAGVARRDLIGGTAPDRVREEAGRVLARVEADLQSLGGPVG
ncbi:MAG: argininosuccinate lyase [Planctomycetota bacterium]